MQVQTISSTWAQVAHDLGAMFAQRSAEHDLTGEFVYENYALLREHRLFSAMVPAEFNGEGIKYSEMCEFLCTLSEYCSSTALALSMHQHLVAAAIWRFKNKGESKPLLQKVATDQTILVSTGAKDWLESNGELTRVDGGYRLTARKNFASGSVIGDMAITSSVYRHPTDGPQVLHFPVSLKAEGVSILDDWNTVGMRGTGSNTIVMKDVFISDAAIVLSRPQGKYHPVWDVVLTVAMPLIMSVYVGIAEKAMKVALDKVKHSNGKSVNTVMIIGMLNNSLVAARTQWKQMIAHCNDINFQPNTSATIEILSLKTNVVKACNEVVQLAVDIVGGQSFYKNHILERLQRDIKAAQFHPLPEWEQYEFTGSRLIG